MSEIYIVKWRAVNSFIIGGCDLLVKGRAWFNISESTSITGIDVRKISGTGIHDLYVAF